MLRALFIHSFIQYGDLYSASSRLLLRSAPGPCTLKRTVLRQEYNVSERILESNRCAKRSPLYTEGPTTENARAWVVEVRAKETKSNPCSNERSELRPLVSGV